MIRGIYVKNKLSKTWKGLNSQFDDYLGLVIKYFLKLWLSFLFSLSSSLFKITKFNLVSFLLLSFPNFACKPIKTTKSQKSSLFPFLSFPLLSYIFRTTKQINKVIQNQNKKHEITSQHENGSLRKIEPIPQQKLHTHGVIYRPLQLTSRVPVQHAADHRPLLAVHPYRLPRWHLSVRRRYRRHRNLILVVVSGGVGRLRWREKVSLIHLGDGQTDGAPDVAGGRRRLQLSAAVWAVDQHRHLGR